jgi:hypothetical protein
MELLAGLSRLTVDEVDTMAGCTGWTDVTHVVADSAEQLGYLTIDQ